MFNTYVLVECDNSSKDVIVSFNIEVKVKNVIALEKPMNQ